jgi:sugar-specific transcriptional regulator TrmB
MSSEPPVEALTSLGFTELEARIYTLLLEESPVTGYRVAQALRKPAPNIYKALESLEAKGAVMVDDGASRLCRPIPPHELLSRLERRFQRERARAAQALSDLGVPRQDDRVYRLRSCDQVLERCRAMLGRCREIALVDIFPLPVELIASELEACANRGVTVAVKVYAPVEVQGASVVLDPDGENVLERWPGQWINLVIDGNEQLVGLLSPDIKQVVQAIWTGSAYLSWVFHSALSAEIILAALQNQMEEACTLEDLRRTLAEHLPLRALRAPGYEAVRGRLTGSSS